MSVLDACVTYLFMYTQYLFLHVKIIQGKKKKKIKLLQIKQILPLQAFQEKFPDQISSHMTECQICPEAQFWMTNFKHVEMIHHGLPQHQQSSSAPIISAFGTEVAPVCDHHLNSTAQEQTAGIKIFITGFQKHLLLTLFCFLLKSVVKVPCRNIKYIYIFTW